MNMSFRSRGFRIIKPKTDGEISTPVEKIYYDITPEVQKNIESANQYDPKILHGFEYSVNNGEIDSINFHVDLNNSYCKIYQDLPNPIKQLFNDIPRIFDARFLNYTIGYRVRNMQIIGETYYFYPTIRKENRFGLKGIIDKKSISDYCVRFCSYMGYNDTEDCKEIQKYFSMIQKFKGIGISVQACNVTDIKIYGRINDTELLATLAGITDHKILNNERYGDIALTAIRIDKSKVTGYNIYYLK